MCTNRARDALQRMPRALDSLAIVLLHRDVQAPQTLVGFCKEAIQDPTDHVGATRWLQPAQLEQRGRIHSVSHTTFYRTNETLLLVAILQIPAMKLFRAAMLVLALRHDGHIDRAA
jgi:hypothetical protein